MRNNVRECVVQRGAVVCAGVKKGLGRAPPSPPLLPSLLPFHLQVVQFARIGAGDDVREVDCEAGDRLRRVEGTPLLEADRAPVPLRHVPTLVGGSALPLALLHEGEGS